MDSADPRAVDLGAEQALADLRTVALLLDQIGTEMARQRVSRANDDHRYAEIRVEVEDAITRMRNDVGATVAHFEAVADQLRSDVEQAIAGMEQKLAEAVEQHASRPKKFRR
jgi:hypothetical protein